MAKSSGLGDRWYVGGYDLSGDTQTLKMNAPQKMNDGTDITLLASARIPAVRDGAMSWVSYYDPASAHPVLSALPTGDVLVTYANGPVLGNVSACMIGKQVNYDPTRAADGSLLFAVDAVANGYAMEWGNLLTAGVRTDTAATNGTSFDAGASSAFGCQAYLQVTAFTGTDVTVKLQDSADNASFADLAGAAFAQVTGAPGFQRVATSNAATVRRYVRASTVTSGGFTSASFVVTLVRNPIAGQVF